MRDKYEIVGEDYAENRRERWLRAISQPIDKPLTVLGVFLAFAAAARGPGLLVPGYEPSGWFVFGLWVCLSVALRLVILGFLAWFRAIFDIPAPRPASAAVQNTEE